MVRPLAKSVYVCDDVFGDASTGKIIVVNLWETARIPTDEAFPYSLPKLCVFVWWRNGHGSARTRIDIVEAGSGKLLRRTKDYILKFSDPSETVYARYMIKDFVFPDVGSYIVEVYCEDEFVDDQVIRVVQ